MAHPEAVTPKSRRPDRYAEDLSCQLQRRPKPMTLEEAILEMQRDSDGLCGLSGFTEKLPVGAGAPPDGNFDLIES